MYDLPVLGYTKEQVLGLWDHVFFYLLFFLLIQTSLTLYHFYHLHGAYRTRKWLNCPQNMISCQGLIIRFCTLRVSCLTTLSVAGLCDVEWYGGK